MQNRIGAMLDENGVMTDTVMYAELAQVRCSAREEYLPREL